MYRRLLRQDVGLECEWVDELPGTGMSCVSGVGYKKLTYAEMSSGRGWTSIGNSIYSKRGQRRLNRDESGVLTGFGSHSDGDLMSGAMFAAWYWDESRREGEHMCGRAGTGAYWTSCGTRSRELTMRGTQMERPTCTGRAGRAIERDDISNPRVLQVPTTIPHTYHGSYRT
jgi:hypothetical protein